MLDLETVDERSDDLHPAAGGRLEWGGRERAVEGPEVAHFDLQAARGPPGCEQDAVVWPGRTVPHGIGDRLGRGEYQVPSLLVFETGLGRCLANDGSRDTRAGGRGGQPCLPPHVAPTG
jgi:hypothetical protein